MGRWYCKDLWESSDLKALLWGDKPPVVANNACFALASQPTLPRVGIATFIEKEL